MILPLAIGCFASSCDKWTLIGKTNFTIDVDINNTHYSREEKYKLTGSKDCKEIKHRNDSTFFKFFFHFVIVNQDNAVSTPLLGIYIVEPNNVERPINGKTYELKKGLQVILDNDVQSSIYFDSWEMTENFIYWDDRKNNSIQATIRDGSLRYTEHQRHDVYEVNCGFYAILELENGELLELSDGKIYIKQWR